MKLVATVLMASIMILLPTNVEAIYQYGAHYTYNAMTTSPMQATGGQATIDVTKPKLSATDYHVITELNVSSGINKSNNIEVGSLVSNYFGISSMPKLVVFYWIDGVPQCFNGCGFVQVSKKYKPGMNLKPGTKLNLRIQRYNDRWNIYVNNDLLGYYPVSLWKGKFININYMTAYGEIAGSTPQATSEMGNGIYGTKRGAARIENFRSIGSKKPHHFNIVNVGQYGDNSYRIGNRQKQCINVCSISFGGRYTPK